MVNTRSILERLGRKRGVAEAISEMKPADQILQIMKMQNCRQIVFSRDPETEMFAILVIDSIPEKRDKFGKLNKEVSSSGGTRLAHTDADAALKDAVRLARAMTLKAKVLGINEGGAKAVVLNNCPKSKRFLHSIGDFIQMQKGSFKTAIDMGFTLKDAKTIFSKTDFIDSLSHNAGGLGSTGENTAEGMIHGFKVISNELLKKPLADCSVSIQGLGSVGMALARRLTKHKCKVIATDIDNEKCNQAKRLGVKIVKQKEIFSQNVDIFAPCAFGGVLTSRSILQLKCKVVAGGANNQLEDEQNGEKLLLNNGIVFIPDFVINCAGFLQALVERNGGNVIEARKRSEIVGRRVKQIINFSRKNDCTLREASIKLFSKEKDRLNVKKCESRRN